MKVQNEYVVAIVYFNDSQQYKLANYQSGSHINFCGTVENLDPLIGALDIDNSIIEQ